MGFFSPPSFVKKYSTLWTIKFSVETFGTRKRQTKTPCYAYVWGRVVEWDSLPFVIIINNDKANFSEKITTQSSELFAGFTLTLVLNFHALVIHTSFERMWRKETRSAKSF